MHNYFEKLFMGEEEPSPKERPLTKKALVKEIIEGFAFMAILSIVTFLAILILG